MIQVGNFRFEDNELNDLPKPNDNIKVGEISSFKANAIGNAEGETIPVLITYRAVLQTSVESEGDIENRMAAIDERIVQLNEEKAKKAADKDKLKIKAEA